MQKIHNADDLKKAIEDLELRKTNEEELIKVHFHAVVESMRPANLVKTTVAEVSDSMHFKKNLVNIALGLGAGLLSKQLVVGKSVGIARSLLGSALEFGISNYVAKQSEELTDNVTPKKSWLGKILKKL
jgi:hypothetical protein